MNNLLYIVFSMATCLAGTAHAEVYRSVDESGNVIFTDKQMGNSEKVDLPGLTTYASPPYNKIEADETKKPITEFTSYSEFKILSPANKETIRDADGGVTLNLQVTPELQVKLGHRIILFLDGKETASTTVSKYKLTKAERGTHTLTAQIVDSNNKTWSEKASVVFNILLSTRGPKKSPGTGYTPDYKSKYDPKPSSDYKPAPSPGYKP